MVLNIDNDNELEDALKNFEKYDINDICIIFEYLIKNNRVDDFKSLLKNLEVHFDQLILNDLSIKDCKLFFAYDVNHDIYLFVNKITQVAVRYGNINIINVIHRDDLSGFTHVLMLEECQNKKELVKYFLSRMVLKTFIKDCISYGDFDSFIIVETIAQFDEIKEILSRVRYGMSLGFGLKVNGMTKDSLGDFAKHILDNYDIEVAIYKN